MATRPQADQLAVHYRQRLDEAHGLLSDGNAPVALDKCLEIRLKSDLGVYGRARLNLLLAKILEHGQRADTFAYKCIDLLDLYRQKYSGEYTTHDERVFQRMEEESKDIIDETERVRRRKEAQFMDDSLEGLHITPPVKQAPATNSRRAWRAKALTPEESAEMARNRGKHEVEIEGYLRVGHDYKPVEHYVALSRDISHDDNDDKDDASSSSGESIQTILGASDQMDLDNQPFLPPAGNTKTTLAFRGGLAKVGTTHDYPTPEPSSEIGQQEEKLEEEAAAAEEE